MAALWSFAQQVNRCRKQRLEPAKAAARRDLLQLMAELQLAPDAMDFEQLEAGVVAACEGTSLALLLQLSADAAGLLTTQMALACSLAPAEATTHP